MKVAPDVWKHPASFERTVDEAPRTATGGQEVRLLVGRLKARGHLKVTCGLIAVQP